MESMLEKKDNIIEELESKVQSLEVWYGLKGRKQIKIIRIILSNIRISYKINNSKHIH